MEVATWSRVELPAGSQAATPIVDGAVDASWPGGPHRYNGRHDPDDAEEADMAKPKKPKKTIDEVLAEFLAEQEPRLAARTFRKYENAVSLLKSYMEGYFPGHDGEYAEVSAAGGTYCGTYGPEDVAGAFYMFNSYFMPRKALCGQETIDAAATMTRKLARWLVAKGYGPDAMDSVD